MDGGSRMGGVSPRFNQRVLATVSSPISEVRSWVAAGRRRQDLPLVDVAQAAPGYPPERGLIDHVSRLDQAAVSRYGPVLGEMPLRVALATELSTAYRAEIRHEQVAVTAGANQAFCLAVSVLCGPGDRVVMPVPYYFNYDMWLSMFGIEAAYLECSAGMLPSVEDAAGLVDGRTRAIVLVTPNNPTGRVYPPELIAAFARLAAERGIHLIVDETYRDFRDTTAPAHDLFGDRRWDRSVIQIQSFSKVYSIPGYRVGAMAASPELLPELLLEVDKVADCLTICPSRIGQEAARGRCSDPTRTATCGWPSPTSRTGTSPNWPTGSTRAPPASEQAVKKRATAATGVVGVTEMLHTSVL